MKKVILFPIVLFLFLGCDDGDIIVNDFNFDADSSLDLCEFQFEQRNVKVLHLVTDSNEAISFTFEQNILENIENVLNPETFSVPITSSNKVNYRRLASSVNGDDYFCQPVPPSQPTVVEEFVSTTGGVVEFTITRESGNNVDTDGDGIPDIQERQRDENGNFVGSIFDYDSDGDGIPNFLDIDDDNDNVLTRVENTEKPEFNRVIENGIIDTDGDGVPNYLDEDDDGDGVLTRYEDLNALDNGTPPDQSDLNPENSESETGVPNYLNPDATESLTLDFFRDNIISRNFTITVVFNNITLESTDSDKTIRLNSQGFGEFRFSTDNELIEVSNE